MTLKPEGNSPESEGNPVRDDRPLDQKWVERGGGHQYFTPPVAPPERWCLRCRKPLPAGSRGLPYCDECRSSLAPADGSDGPRPVCSVCKRIGCTWVENPIFPHPGVGSWILRERRFLTAEQLRQILARELGLSEPPATFWRVQPDGEFVGVVVW